VTEAAADRAEPILRLRGVGRRFGGVHAVRDVDLDISYGERRAILGPNGAGKTTLFNLVAGDFAPTTGTIEVMGQDVTGLPARLRPKLGLARTYQKTRLFPGLSVIDNVVLALVGYGGGRLRVVPTKSDRENRERAQAAAERVWLGAKADTLVRDLSHGEQRQLEVGMASAVEPRLMMLDEPASGLDPRARVEIRELLLEIARLGKTIIFSSHILADVAELCTSVGIMEDGKVVAVGTLDQLSEKAVPHRLIRIAFLNQISIEKAQAALSSLPTISQVRTPEGLGKAEWVVLEAEFNGDDEALRQLLASLIEQGLPIVHFSEETQNLEQVFMRATRGIVS